MGQGENVAGSGENGVEGRYAPNRRRLLLSSQLQRWAFYNQNKPVAKAYILAVERAFHCIEDDAVETLALSHVFLAGSECEKPVSGKY